MFNAVHMSRVLRVYAEVRMKYVILSFPQTARDETPL
jgi:hypothetical protein